MGLLILSFIWGEVLKVSLRQKYQKLLTNRSKASTMNVSNVTKVKNNTSEVQ